MTNDEIPEDPDLGAEADDGFEDFEGGQGTFGNEWRDNPLVKIGIVVGGLVLVIGGIILFGSGSPDPDISKMTSAPNVSEPPGTNEVSPAYAEQVRDKDAEAVEIAIKTGTSAFPTPITPPVGPVMLPGEEEPEDDPLERWRRIQEERQRRVEEKPEPPQGDPNAEVVGQLAGAMQAQMESILQAKQPVMPMHAIITPPKPFVYPEDEVIGGGDGDGDGDGNGGDDDIEEISIILPAGTIEYAQLITEADSDVPGPIMARIVSGPLAGSRVLGAFEVSNEYMVLNFDTIVIDGVSYSVEAVALNPETTKIGMVTDVDHKYFKRIILPAAASFIEGFGSAVAQTGSTTTNTGNGSTIEQNNDLDTREELLSGVEEASGTLSEILQEEADKTEVQVRVRSGTPMGILFLNPVTKE